MRCHEARRTGDLEHFSACSACRRLFEPKTTFEDLRARLTFPPTRSVGTFSRLAVAASLLAAVLLGHVASPPSLACLAQALEHGDDAEALRAVHALQQIGGPVAERHLIEAVPALLERTRGGAAAFLPALAEIGDPRAIRPLLDALDEPGFFPVAARGLARMQTRELREELELFAVGATPEEAAALARTPISPVREAALFIAARDSDCRRAVLEAADPVLLILAAGETPLERSAIEELRRRPSEAVSAALRRALQEDTSVVPAVRLWAALRAADAVPYLIPLLDTSAAEEAHRALVAITGVSLKPRRSDWTLWWLKRRLWPR
ncbi:MAG: HEAT repeat domain-containing protein [Planctomycetes bacterium]|nr:HEAT repeat domain-containing protein [Planctomycetota bacterium]